MKTRYAAKRVRLEEDLALQNSMDTLIEKLDSKLREWQPSTAEDVRQRVAEIMELADQDALDLSRSRIVEQEVLDLLDKPASR